MKILILGAGKMGSFFTDLLSFDHEVAVYDIDPKKLRFMYNTQRFTTMEEISAFEPELVINAVSLKYTLKVFDEVIPHLPKSCILSDISSVKTGFKEYYEASGFHYVSTHPMFGPTFANLGKLSDENATTFKRHMKIAKGVLSEDDPLLREILFNPYTKGQVEQIRKEMKEIIEIIDTRDEEHMQQYLTKIRKNIK